MATYSICWEFLTVKQAQVSVIVKAVTISWNFSGMSFSDNSSCHRPPLLMLHGLMGDASEFVINPPESSPGEREFLFRSAWGSHCRLRWHHAFDGATTVPFCSGMILADAGFDIFMLNVRGTYYSQRHVNLTKDDREYWKFRWFLFKFPRFNRF